MPSMTTAVPTKASTPSHARTVLSVFQLGDENTLNHHGLRPDRLLDRVNNIVYNGYDAVSRYIVRASHRTATPTVCVLNIATWSAAVADSKPSVLIPKPSLAMVTETQIPAKAVMVHLAT